jgi:hypothetical protein
MELLAAFSTGSSDAHPCPITTSIGQAHLKIHRMNWFMHACPQDS